jgi:hypothetical protein
MVLGTETKFESWIKDLPRATLGGLIKEYVAESNHSSWEGFGPRDMTGIRKLFEDLRTFYEHAMPEPQRDYHFGTKTTNVNIVP